MIRRGIAERERMEPSNLAADNERWRRGGVLLLAGPDGVGKTTLSRALEETVLVDRPLLHAHHRRGVGVLPARKPQGPTSEPHRHPPYGRLVSAGKLLYLYLDFLLGFVIRTRPFVNAGGWVILQRNWWDLLVDPLRYRLRPMPRLARRLGRLLPQPDLILVLEADPRVIRGRKEELAEGELERQMRAWRSLLPTDRCVFLDVGSPPDQVVSRAREEIERFLDARAARMSGIGWIRLPSRTDPRWVIPRGPRRISRAALRIYHPMTRRGLVAWHIARALAALGALRLLPRGEPPQVDVRRLLAPWTPPGGAMAIGRGSVSGRDFALLLDREGREAAWAKIATDTEGRRLLLSEARNLEGMRKRLPPPLSAPAVLSVEEGLLVLEAVAWEPRARPWLLPPDVAEALGAFARGTPPRCHGDVAPWNLLRTRAGWRLVDWEHAGEGIPFQDLFHFLFRAHVHLGRPRYRSLLAGLEGKGAVGRVVDAYARGAGRLSREAPSHLAAYLEAQLSTLGTARAEDRLAIDVATRLLSELRKRGA
jgi:thymidylate kinase